LEPKVSRKRIRHTALSLIVLLSAASLLAAQTPERVTLSGSRVGIWNIAGNISVGAGTGRAVEVSVTRRGPDGAKLTLAHGPIGGRETLRVLYPDGDIVARIRYSDRAQVGTGGNWRTDLTVQDDGTFGGDDYRRHGDRDGHRVRVSTSGSGTEAYADLDVAVPAGQEIAIFLAVGQITARNVDGKILLDTHGADVSASAMKGDLSIDAGSGDVEVRGMQGPLSIDVGSGDLTLADVKGPTLDLDTGSGDVRGDGMAADDLKVDTGSGDVELSGLVAQRAKIDVGSGDVTLGWTTDPGDVDIDSGSGDVTLTLPANAGGTVDLESSSGDIESAFEITTTHIERDALRGTFGDAKGRIAVETGSGDVHLLKR
jgi:lia operon protein LiaG